MALHVPQSSCITEAIPSDYLVSYPGHLFGEFYSFVEMQSVYSAAPADWAKIISEIPNCNTHILERYFLI